MKILRYSLLSLTFFFVLCITLSLGSFAYAEVSGEANVTSHLRAGDGTVSDWNSDLPHPPVDATNIELAGLIIYCPDGYSVYSVEINGQDITSYGCASANNPSLVFTAMTFSLNPYSYAPVIIEPYNVNIDITYTPLSGRPDNCVTYTAGVNELPYSLREQNIFYCEDGVHYVRGNGQEFAAETPAGWLPSNMVLTYPNGTSVQVSSGQRITPYDNCTIQIVYVLPITVAVNDGLSATYGSPLPSGTDAYNYYTAAYADLSDIYVDANMSYYSTDIGTHNANIGSVAIYKGDKLFSEREYQLTIYNGWINIYKTPLVITSESAEKIYDGTPLSCGEFKVDGLCEGDYVDYIINNSSLTVAGTIDNSISGVVIKNGDVDVTDNYDISFVSGTLTVKPADIGIAVKDCTLPYNGHAQTSNEYKISGALGEGDNVSVKCSGSATFVSDGRVSVTPVSAAVYNSNGEDVTFCYNIKLDTVNPGSIMISKRPVSIYANNLCIEYSGKEISAASAGAHVSDDTPLADTDILESVITNGKLTYIGETAIIVSDAVIKCENKNVNDNYSITYNPGKMSIIPVEGKGTVTVTLGATKVYDGTELRNAFTWTADDAAKIYVRNVAVPGSTIGPDVTAREMPSENAVIRLIGDDEIGVLDNSEFNIVVVSGTASITKQTLKISPSDTAKNYDGKAYVGSINREGSLAGGAKVSVRAYIYPYLSDIKVDGVAVGTYTLKVDTGSVKILDSNGNNISTNFDISYGDAKLKVTANVSSANYSKTSGGTVTINCSITPKELKSVSLDGVELTSRKDYVTANGSETMITIVNAALKDLETGNHKLVLHYQNAGDISTTVSVSENGKTSSSALNFSFKK